MLFRMRKTFPLFQSHLDLAHFYWSQLIHIGDTVIDATCGNGHDTIILGQLALSKEKGRVYAFDIQQEAIESAKNYLSSHFEKDLFGRIDFQIHCHSTFPSSLQAGSVKLIAYNLGYLPGGISCGRHNNRPLFKAWSRALAHSTLRSHQHHLLSGTSRRGARRRGYPLICLTATSKRMEQLPSSLVESGVIAKPFSASVIRGCEKIRILAILLRFFLSLSA